MRKNPKFSQYENQVKATTENAINIILTGFILLFLKQGI
ncbi:hypothetical protein O59_002407 [Cellvibrio sp. BR]|nr:hypothetical protein O59_002407 [Cellvibrio sp. BR]